MSGLLEHESSNVNSTAGPDGGLVVPYSVVGTETLHEQILHGSDVRTASCDADWLEIRDWVRRTLAWKGLVALSGHSVNQAIL